MDQHAIQTDRGDFTHHNVSIPLYLILTLLTCGIFNLYWNYRQMQACNEMVGRNEFSWPRWFFLSLLTCGIYHLFYQYKMGSVIVEIQRKYHVVVFDSLPIVSILVAVFGASIIVDIIHQYEINKFSA